MASFTDQIPQFNPYVQQLPVEAMVTVGMEKQRRYDEGIQKIQTSIDNVAGLDVVRDIDKVYLQSTLNQLGSNLKMVAAGDFSNYQLVNSVSGMANQIIKDPVIQNAVGSTAKYRKEVNYAESLKKEGKTSPNRDFDFSRSASEWLNSQDVNTSFNGQYVAHTDVNKKTLDIIQKLHPNAKILDNPYVTNPDGSVNYKEVAIAMRKSGIKEVSEAQIKTAVNSMLDATDLDELASQGRYNYRNYSAEDLQQAATENYSTVKKSYESTLEQLKTQLAATTDLGQQEELNKSIKYYKDQLGEGEDSGILVKNFKTTLELIPQNIDGARSQLYTKNWLNQIGNGFAYREVSDEIVTSPLRADFWKVKEFEFNTIKEQNDQYWKQLDYNIKLQTLELAKQEAADKASGGDPYWNPSGDPSIDAMNAMSNWAGKQESLAQSNKAVLQEITNNIPAVNGVKPSTMDVWNNINKYKKGEYQPRTSEEKVLMDKYIANSNDLTNQKAIYEQKEAEVYKEMGLDFNKSLSKQLSGISGITIGTGNNKTTITPREIYDYLKKEKAKIVGKADAQQLYIDPATLTEREKLIYNLVQGRYQGVGYAESKSTGNAAIDAVINKIAPISSKNSGIDSEVKRRIGLKMAPITGGFSREQAGVTFKDGTDKSNFVIAISNIVQSDLKQKTGGKDYVPADVFEALTKAKLDDVDFQVGRQGDSYVVQVTDKGTKKTYMVPVTAEFVAKTKQLGTKWLSQNVPVADRVLRNAGSTNLTGKFENSYYSTGLFGGTVQGKRTVTLPVAADLTYEGGQTFPLFRMMDKNGEQLFYQYYDATDPKTFKDVYLPSLTNDKILKLFKNKYPNIEQLISQ
jgi:hypothetical protein